jgi:hypothetical protein
MIVTRSDAFHLGGFKRGNTAAVPTAPAPHRKQKDRPGAAFRNSDAAAALSIAR